MRRIIALPVYTIVFAAFVLIALFSRPAATPALACSGPYYDFIVFSIFEAQASIVGRGRIVEVDEIAQNGILAVDEYYAGDIDSPFLLVKQGYHPSTLYAISTEAIVEPQCSNLRRPLQVGEAYYFALQRELDGSYHTFWMNGLLAIEDVEAYLESDSIYSNYRDDQQPRTESEMVRWFGEYFNSSPKLPDFSKPYPMKSSVHITTSFGVDYLLPIDGSTPIPLTQALYRTLLLGNDFEDDYHLQWYQYRDFPCRIDDCGVFSPNRVHIGSPELGLVFLRDGFYAQGQAFVFAPNNRTVAVWNNDILTAIPLLTTDRDYGGEPVQQNIMLEGDSDVLSALSGKGAWSPDGSLLAYSDERGLWLWDALQPFGPPTLLLRANLADIPTAVRFSPLGNYLLIAQNDPFRNRQKVRFWLDLRTMQTIRDGVISPDEMFLVAVNTDPLETAMGRSPLQMCFLDPDGERCGGQSRNYIVEQIEWRDNRRYIMTTCANENYDTPCWVRTYYFEGARDPSYFAPSRPPSWESPYYYSLYRGRSFDYDPLHDSVVSIVDEDTIRVDDQVYQIRAMLDGSDYLSADDTFGEIVKVEWMPSLFYHD